VNRSHPRALFLAAIPLLLAASARAQAGGGFDLSWNTIDAGGATSAGGAYALSGTVGQPDAGPEPAGMTGGTWTLVGGFCPGIGPVPCRPDLNGDGQVNVADFLTFLSLFSAGDPRADFNADTQINVADFLAFLSAYAAGCT
jgi:hypothetical protein